MAVFAALLLTPLHFLPAEDAVILHQYSRNLAEHGAITYFPGGPHAEGATEFLWMLFLAGAMRLHLPPMAVTAGVNALSLVLVGVLLLRLAGLRPTAPRLLAIAGAAGLLPQILAALAGFPVLPFALLLTALTVAVVEGRTAAAALLGLAVCLFRPDAPLIALPLLLTLLRQPRGRSRRLLWLCAGFVLPGALYFVWRAHYFGELFPLPFLVKGQVARRFGVLVPHSVTQSVKYLLLDAALLAPLVRRHRMPRSLALALVAIPTLFYWTVRLDQNVGDRFFVYLPLGAGLLLAFCWPALQGRERSLLLRAGAAAFVVLLLGPLLREVRSFRRYQFRAVHAFATGLRSLPVRGTLLTSEAGYLAYDSGWVAFDAWGLNTATFAHRLIVPADVLALRPDLIVLHPNHTSECTPAATSAPLFTKRTWEGMVGNVAHGAQQAGTYQLWLLPYGSAVQGGRARREADLECFFLDRRSPDYPGMLALLQRHGAQPGP